MSENKGDLDFSMPPRQWQKPARKCRCIGVLVVLNVLTLCAVAWLLFRPSGAALATAAGAESADGAALLEYAQKLEGLGLAHEAAKAWKDYIAVSRPDAEKEAKLWYRIGTVQQEGRLYEEALASFYRSEMVCKVSVLDVELTRRTQQCLEALGKQAAIRRNLENRTSLEGEASKGELPLVEIGAWRIYRKDAEAMLERQVDAMLATSQLAPAELAQRKKEMLKAFSDGSRMQDYLKSMVCSEVLERAALDDKLNEDVQLREQIIDMERRMLAEAFMKKALAGLDASDSEIEDYYKAHVEQFTEPAAVKLAHIQFGDKERAKAALKSLGEGETFENLAKLLSQDKDSADKGGVVPGWSTAEAGPEWRRAAAKQALTGDGKTQLLPEPVQVGDSWHVVKILERRKATVKELKDEGVRRQARQMLMQRKTQEAQNRLLEDLMKRYQVVWHQGQSAAKEEGNK